MANLAAAVVIICKSLYNGSKVELLAIRWGGRRVYRKFDRGGNMFCDYVHEFLKLVSK